MRSLRWVTLILVLCACACGSNSGLDAGPDTMDDGGQDGGVRADGGSDAGQTMDAGPSPVRAQMNAVTAFADCRAANTGTPLYFGIVLQYTNDDSANAHAATITS